MNREQTRTVLWIQIVSLILVGFAPSIFLKPLKECIQHVYLQTICSASLELPFFFFLVETAVSVVDKSVLFLLLLKIKNSWTLMLALVPNFWHMKHYKIWCEIFTARQCLYHSMSSTSSRALRFQFDFSLVDLLANFTVVSV